MFKSAIRTEATMKTYNYYLKRFCEETNLTAEQIIELGTSNTKELTRVIIEFILGYKELEKEGKISVSIIQGFYNAVKLLCVMNDVILNWSKIFKTLPSTRTGKDRAITADEIKQLLKCADLRSKALILLMASSGIRVGAIPDLRVKHLKLFQEDNKTLASSLQVYAGSNQEYSTFITPEAYEAVQEYLEYRKCQGEYIDSNSTLFRNKFRSDASKPEPLERDAIRAVVHRLLKEAGIRRNSDKGAKRFEFQADHGFRKFFKTRCEQSMKPIHVEMLMGHSTGVSGRYYRPNERELLEDYLKAVPTLTIQYQILPQIENKYVEQQMEIEKLKRDFAEVKRLLDDLNAIRNMDPVQFYEIIREHKDCRELPKETVDKVIRSLYEKEA